MSHNDLKFATLKSECLNRRLGNRCTVAALSSLINAVLCVHIFFNIYNLEILFDI